MPGAPSCFPLGKCPLPKTAGSFPSFTCRCSAFGHPNLIFKPQLVFSPMDGRPQLPRTVTPVGQRGKLRFASPVATSHRAPPGTPGTALPCGCRSHCWSGAGWAALGSSRLGWGGPPRAGPPAPSRGDASRLGSAVGSAARPVRGRGPAEPNAPPKRAL